MKKLIAFAMMILLMVSHLTVQAKDTNTEPITAKEEVEKMLAGLVVSPAGRAYPGDNYIKTGYGIMLEKLDMTSFEEELQKAVETYNECHDLEIEYTIRLFSEKYGGVDFQSKNVYYMEHTPDYIGSRARVAEGRWKYYESSKNFGSGKSGTIEVKDGETKNVIITGVAYMTEEGSIISSDFNDGDDIKFAELRMLHISTEEGVDLGWIWPLCLVQAEAE